MDEKIIIFFCLWDSIINKIKYVRADDVMFDYNQVIIKDSNKIRFSSDAFIPDDLLLRFYSLVFMSLKKMMNLFQKFMLMKDILQKYSIK